MNCEGGGDIEELMLLASKMVLNTGRPSAERSIRTQDSCPYAGGRRWAEYMTSTCELKRGITHVVRELNIASAQNLSFFVGVVDELLRRLALYLDEAFLQSLKASLLTRLISHFVERFPDNTAVFGQTTEVLNLVNTGYSVPTRQYVMAPHLGRLATDDFKRREGGKDYHGKVKVVARSMPLY